MRDYVKTAPTFWIDHKGRQWKTPITRSRLKFHIFVFNRDGFRCQKCGSAADPPIDYDGRDTVSLSFGWCFVADHIVSRRNGGSHHPDNLMTLYDSCNARKSCLVDAKERISCTGR